MTKLALEFVDSIEAIGLDNWNKLSGTDNPFTRYEFLHALEITGCTTKQSGWEPHHAAVYEVDEKAEEAGEAKTPVAVVPLYLKTNSWGEYVFDWSWANAYQSHGFEYYPKFVTAAPFTPSVGKRFFIDEKLKNKNRVFELLVEKVKEKAQFIGASSWHILFPLSEENELLSHLDLQPRIATQFHWSNPGYESFDDFLNQLTSRKRKSLKKERRQVTDQGITFRRTEGAAITEDQWSDFYLYYQSTYAMRGMTGYLKNSFFHLIAQTMPEQMMLVNAQQDGRDIAAALFFKNKETLFGRYWGSAADYQFLHFETCYYQGQDYAIEHNIKSFDSGAQGEHKIQRGFKPIITHSNHWLAHQGFQDAIGNFLEEERPHINRYLKSAEEMLPFKSE